jgi:serine carboxypeptidase 1
MTAEIALYLDQAIKAGNIRSNFKGVGLGDSWISPVDSSLTWSPYLYNLGFLDTQQYGLLNERALELKNLLDTGKWEEATNAWLDLEDDVVVYTEDVDFYNVLTKTVTIWSPLMQFRHLYKPGEQSDLTDDYSLMKQVQLALNISNNWGGNTTEEVFIYLQVDFMKPVTDIVERLLNETDLTVAVYNGQLDLIVDTPGTIDWVDRLNYKGSEEWAIANKNGFGVDNILEGYEKKAGNLKFYWVLRSGHMVPSDNPSAMLYILHQVTDNFKV